jgi:hypothetical protein
MPSPQARSQVVLDVGIGENPLRTRPEPDTPFRIAILGRLRGDSSSPTSIIQAQSTTLIGHTKAEAVFETTFTYQYTGARVQKWFMLRAILAFDGTRRRISELRLLN